MGNSASIYKGRHSIAQKVLWLKTSPLFVRLTDEEISKVASLMSTKKFPMGYEVEGREDQIFIVGSGELKVSMALPSENRKVESDLFLCTKRPGDIVNIAATKRNARMSLKHKKLADLCGDVEVVTSTETVVLTMKKTSLDTLAHQNPDLYTSIQPIVAQSIIDYLRPLDFLSNLSERKMNVLAEMCRFEVFDEDETILKENTTASTFYIILEGFCDICLEDTNFGKSNSFQLQRSFSGYGRNLLSNHFSELSPNIAGRGDEKQTAEARLEAMKIRGRRRRTSNESIDDSLDGFMHLASLGAGSYFGETGLLMNMPRTTTVRSKAKVLLLSIQKSSFQSFLTVCPELKREMIRGMIQRLLPKLRLLQIPILRPFEDEFSLLRLVDHAEMHLYKRGAQVCEEGEDRASLFILIYGTARSTRTENIEGIAKNSFTHKLYPGQVFGEDSFTAKKMGSSVKCTGDSVILELKNSMVDELVEADRKARFNIIAQRDRCCVDDIINYPEANTTLRRFLVLEHNNENIDFINQVLEYLENHHLHEQDNLHSAQMIYNQYIHSEAPKQVNIRASMRDHIEESLLNGTYPSKEIFDEAFVEVSKLISQDALPRFKRSNFFKHFLDGETNDRLAQKRMQHNGPCSEDGRKSRSSNVSRASLVKVANQISNQLSIRNKSNQIIPSPKADALLSPSLVS